MVRLRQHKLLNNFIVLHFRYCQPLSIRHLILRSAAWVLAQLRVLWRPFHRVFTSVCLSNIVRTRLLSYGSGIPSRSISSSELDGVFWTSISVIYSLLRTSLFCLSVSVAPWMQIQHFNLFEIRACNVTMESGFGVTNARTVFFGC